MRQYKLIKTKEDVKRIYTEGTAADEIMTAEFEITDGEKRVGNAHVHLGQINIILTCVPKEGATIADNVALAEKMVDALNA